MSQQSQSGMSHKSQLACKAGSLTAALQLDCMQFVLQLSMGLFFAHDPVCYRGTF